MVKLGVMPRYRNETLSRGYLEELAGTLEAVGVESIWAVEHVIVAEAYEPRYPYSTDGRMPTGRDVAPMPDPLEILSFLGALGPSLTLGTAVVVAPLHSPTVLAKRAATVDRISGGRLRLGLGIGWQREEYDAVGAPFDDRGRRLEECIEAMRALWADHPASYEGRYIAFDRVHLEPRPSGDAVPIVLGGNSDAAVRRAGRLADGWFPYTISAEDFARQADLLRDTATEAGRAAADVELTAWPGSHDADAELDVGWVRRYVEAGASRLIVRSTATGPEELPGLRERLVRYQDEVLANL